MPLVRRAAAVNSDGKMSIQIIRVDTATGNNSGFYTRNEAVASRRAARN